MLQRAGVKQGPKNSGVLMNKNAIKYGFYSVLGFAAVVVFAISNGNVPKLPFLGDDDAQIEEAAGETALTDDGPLLADFITIGCTNLNCSAAAALSPLAMASSKARRLPRK